MRPPQDRPTRQAVSSATPNSSIFGLPAPITSSASVDHRAFDAAARDRAVEIAVGVDDEMAADRPRRRAPGLDDGGDRHLLAVLHPALGDHQRIAGFVEMAVAFMAGPPCRKYGHAAPALPRPATGADRSRRDGLADSEAQRSVSALRLCTGAELVDMRQHGADAAGPRLETVEAQQRVQPDQPPAGFVQPLHLLAQAGDVVALQPVGDQQHDRALPEHAARPEPVELVRACRRCACRPTSP